MGPIILVAAAAHHTNSFVMQQHLMYLGLPARSVAVILSIYVIIR
jgi:hypothetical protein